MEAGYRERLPLIPGAVEAVERLAARWPLGLASSSNRELIDLALEARASPASSRATVSSEEVAARKAGAGRLPGGRAAPGRAGPTAAPRSRTPRTASSARRPPGCACWPFPTRSSHPAEHALAEADLVLDSIAELTPEVVDPG